MGVFAGTLSDSLAYRLADVRFGSLADITMAIRDVRLTPKSGHARLGDGCPLSANSRHSPFETVGALVY
jgi:hypothetical protein